jgi:hypothetical protein
MTIEKFPKFQQKFLLSSREGSTVGVGVAGSGAITTLAWSKETSTLLAATEYGVVIGWSLQAEE